MLFGNLEQRLKTSQIEAKSRNKKQNLETKDIENPIPLVYKSK